MVERIVESSSKKALGGDRDEIYIPPLHGLAIGRERLDHGGIVFDSGRS